ncbi:MAG: RDD family protein, partial [Mycobacterium sp.]|nr:RDD family protein [Mycobacterium sp.]
MSTTPGSVVTGDAVVLDVQIAQLPVRALAALVDLIVVGAGYILALLLWGSAVQRFDDAFASAVMVIFTVALLVGYPVAMEMTTRGRSLGKMVMGLRVVADDGGPERFRQALFRALAGVVEIWLLLGSPAVICSLLSARGKRIGDIFAGTVVISERGPKSPGPPAMPPALAGWAQSLELSGLGPQQAEMARQFLARASELTPTVRTDLGYRVAAEVVSRVSPPPPAGATTEQVLA